MVPPWLDGANLSRGIARIVPSAALRPAFLVCYLRSSVAKDYWGTMMQGSTFGEVSIETVRELPVPLPPPEEQDRIVAEVSELTTRVETAVASLRQQVALLSEYRQALITAAVTGQLDVTKEAA